MVKAEAEAGAQTGGSDLRITWGEWGHAVVLTFRYAPAAGADVEAKQALRLGRTQNFTFKLGARVRVLGWGVMPSGMLRHPSWRRRDSPRHRLFEPRSE